VIIALLLTLLWAIWIIIAGRQHHSASRAPTIPRSDAPTLSHVRRAIYDKLERRIRKAQP
jgi:hypothetical protein